MHSLGWNQSKLIKSLMSCDGHLILKNCLGKYLSESFETLEGKIKKRYAKNFIVIVMMLVPGPFNGYCEMKHNSAITCQNQLGFWNENAKQNFL